MIGSCGSEGIERERHCASRPKTTEHSVVSRQSAQCTAASHHNQNWYDTLLLRVKLC